MWIALPILFLALLIVAIAHSVATAPPGTFPILPKKRRRRPVTRGKLVVEIKVYEETDE